MNTTSLHWHLLITSLPTTGATARMRLGRAIKALGDVPLRDGAYVLPERPGHTDPWPTWSTKPMPKVAKPGW